MTTSTLRTVVCTACGSTFAVAPEPEAIGADECDCPECRIRVWFSYDQPDPMQAKPHEVASGNGEEIPF